MELTDLESELLNELVLFVETWRVNNSVNEDVLEGDNLTKFVSDLQTKIVDTVSLEGSRGQTLILYTGSSVETGKKLPEGLSDFCKNNSDYYYITSTEGGDILWHTKFKDAIIKTIGDDDIANRVLSGCEFNESTGLYDKRINQYAIEGTDILSFDDFISKTLTESAVENGNNIIYVAGEGWNSKSVGMTEYL